MVRRHPVGAPWDDEPADPKQSKSPVGVVQPRTGRFLKPQTLDRIALPINPGDDPRVQLAKWMTDPNNQYVEANQFGELNNVIEVD